MSKEELLQNQKAKFLSADKFDYQRIVVRQRHLWQDALHRFNSGMNFTKYIRVTFVGEPAVDDGGPLREFLHLLMVAIANNNQLFQGGEACRVPTPNMVELQKQTYKHVGEMMAVSLIHGGPPPAFIAPSVVDYIIYGIGKVKATVKEAPTTSLETIWQRLAHAESMIFYACMV